jgi:hypothetical protein
MQSIAYNLIRKLILKRFFKIPNVKEQLYPERLYHLKLLVDRCQFRSRDSRNVKIARFKDGHRIKLQIATFRNATQLVALVLGVLRYYYFAPHCGRMQRTIILKYTWFI